MFWITWMTKKKKGEIYAAGYAKGLEFAFGSGLRIGRALAEGKPVIIGMMSKADRDIEEILREKGV